MKKVTIQPGICGLITSVTAEKKARKEVQVTVKSACQHIHKFNEVMGDTFNPYDVCLTKISEGPFYEYAKNNLPPHASCPFLCGLITCIEVECGLALPKDAYIKFEEE